VEGGQFEGVLASRQHETAVGPLEGTQLTGLAHEQPAGAGQAPVGADHADQQALGGAFAGGCVGPGQAGCGIGQRLLGGRGLTCAGPFRGPGGLGGIAAGQEIDGRRDGYEQEQQEDDGSTHGQRLMLRRCRSASSGF
jgi:hypothetical protein